MSSSPILNEKQTNDSLLKYLYRKNMLLKLYHIYNEQLYKAIPLVWNYENNMCQMLTFVEILSHIVS